MFNTALMKHQQSAVNKLSQLKVGALFMDMGTGKTRTFLEVAYRKVEQSKASRIVIICPVSGKQHLAAEVRKHMGMDAVVYGSDYVQTAGLVNIIGTESMSSSITAINKLHELCAHAVVIQDESHQIKNRAADRTRRIIDATRQCQYRYISTGTPMSNGVEDLWAQCEFLSPLILGYHNFAHFQRMHLKHSMDWTGSVGQGRIVGRFNTELIAKKLGAYSFEARKSDCLDLPDKTYSFQTASMNNALSHIYNEAKRVILQGQNAFDVEDATIYRLFTTLQQVSLGILPEWLAKELDVLDVTFDNPKLNILIEQIEALPRCSKKIVWCKYHTEADDVAIKLKTHGYTVVQIDGRIKPQTRFDNIQELKDNADVLVATAATGGQVLDIGFADYAIYMSNSFDYQVRAQSEDRIHRYGMSDKAHYIDIYTECGIERKIQRSLGRKENAATAFMKHVRQLRALSTKEAKETLQMEFETL